MHRLLELVRRMKYYNMQKKKNWTTQSCYYQTQIRQIVRMKNKIRYLHRSYAYRFHVVILHPVFVFRHEQQRMHQLVV